MSPSRKVTWWMKKNLPTSCFLVLQFVFLSLVFEMSEGALEFLDWSKACKIPRPSEFLRPNEECDSSRGLICQKYSQGDFCGCQIGGPLSFDRQSRECRRKPTSYCAYEPNDALKDQLKFNQKCHEWAECIKVNTSAVTGKKNSEDVHLCSCKEGYIISNDQEECTHLKGIGSGHRLSVHHLPFILSPIFLIFAPPLRQLALMLLWNSD